MVIVDSSGWIEFFTDGPHVKDYARYLKDASALSTPAIILYEVYKKIKRERTEEEALSAISIITRTKIIPLTESIALLAADLSLKHSLPMADAIVYATALEHDCAVVTGDDHFKGLEKAIIVE